MTDGSRESAWPSDPLRALLGFHGRIRTSLAALDTLAADAGTGAPDPRVARALYDFFTGPVVWHDVDEESSLLPRLRRTQHPPRLERVLDAVSEAHGQLEGKLRALCAHLDDVAAGRVTADAEVLARMAREVRTLIEAHLRMEEQEILPLARLLLSEADLEAMAGEMAERLVRRRGDSGLGGDALRRP